MRILSLDLSKESTGWACYGPGDRSAASGFEALGSEYTPPGRVFGKLHELMSGIAAACGDIEALFIEDALTPEKLHGHTNIGTTKLQLGLAAHALSWADAMAVRVVREVNMSTWRRHFIGRMPRATRTAQLKEYAMQRCRELGFRPRRHDEAEAIGLLDYACSALDLTPPWRAEFRLEAELARGAA